MTHNTNAMPSMSLTELDNMTGKILSQNVMKKAEIALILKEYSRFFGAITREYLISRIAKRDADIWELFDFWTNSIKTKAKSEFLNHNLLKIIRRAGYSEMVLDYIVEDRQKVVGINGFAQKIVKRKKYILLRKIGLENAINPMDFGLDDRLDLERKTVCLMTWFGGRK